MSEEKREVVYVPVVPLLPFGLLVGREARDHMALAMRELLLAMRSYLDKRIESIDKIVGKREVERKKKRIELE